jgi:hypothetical protein
VQAEGHEHSLADNIPVRQSSVVAAHIQSSRSCGATSQSSRRAEARRQSRSSAPPKIKNLEESWKEGKLRDSGEETKGGSAG